MNQNTKPSVELFIATGCTHCPVVLKELSENIKRGEIASLNITNIAVDNKKAEELNIRSVPWFSLSNNNSFMIFSGEHSPKEIKQWLAVSQTDDGMQEYIEELLKGGQLLTVANAIQIKPEIYSHVVKMLEDEETSMDIRIGLDALTESLSDTGILKRFAPDFKKIASNDNVRLQIDALHYLALTADSDNKEFLLEKTNDKNPQISEAAKEAVETLDDLIN